MLTLTITDNAVETADHWYDLISLLCVSGSYKLSIYQPMQFFFDVDHMDRIPITMGT